MPARIPNYFGAITSRLPGWDNGTGGGAWSGQFGGRLPGYDDGQTNLTVRSPDAGGISGYFAALTEQPAGGVVNSSIGAIRKLRLPKNDSLEALNIGNIGRVRSDTAANDADLRSYFDALRTSTASNAGDLAQESSFINEAFNGGLDERLGGIRGNYATTQRGSIRDATAALSDARLRLRGEQTGNIDSTSAQLAAERAAYEGRVGGEITAEERSRLGLRNQLGVARRRATDVAIADSSRATKSQLANSGGGGGSYFSRLALGTRSRAEAALANDLADRAYSDYGLTRSQRAALTETVSGRQRGEIGAAGDARLRLGDVLGAQERADLGYTLGREDTLNRDVSNADRSDLQYVRDNAGRLVGVRRGLRTAADADALAPINARSAVTRGQIQDTGSIGNIDLANTFYGLDDGRGDGVQFPGIPYLNRSRPQPGAPTAGPNGGYQQDPGQLPYQPGATQAAPNAAARNAYFQAAGVYPENDPNFSAELWSYAQQQQPAAPAYHYPTEYYGPTANPIPLRPEERYDGSYIPPIPYLDQYQGYDAGVNVEGYA